MPAALSRSIRQRIAHLAARTVADKAHRVNRLLRRTSRHYDVLAFHIALSAGQPIHLLGNEGRVRKSARAGLPASKRATIGVDHHASVAFQQLDVALRGRMIPHGRIHGRAKHHRPAKRKVQRGKEVVSHPMGELSKKVGSRGRNHQRLVIPRNSNVFYRARQRLIPAILREQMSNDFLSAQGRECQRLNEVLGRLCHHDLHAMAPRFQGTY